MTDSVGVRRATPEDVDAVVDLFEAVVGEGRWMGTEPPLDRVRQRRRFLEETEDTATMAALVAVVDGQVVGHARVEVAPYNVAGLGMMVDARWRGRGVGAALVRVAVERTRQLGAHKLAVQVWPHNVAARRLFQRHGFAEEGVLRRHYPRANGELWDAVIMGLVLDETSPGSSLDPAPTAWRRPSP